MKVMTWQADYVVGLQGILIRHQPVGMHPAKPPCSTAVHILAHVPLNTQTLAGSRPIPRLCEELYSTRVFRKLTK
jgi:hypothetical protein